MNNFKHVMLILYTFAMVSVCGERTSFAQSEPIAALTEDEQMALAQINEKRVTAAISFLASDELRGRGTGTEEFDIAAAYVASRFRGAGLDTGGDNDTYYQVTEHKVTHIPENGIHFVGESGAVTYYGLASAGSEAVSYHGKIEQANLGPDAKHFGPVWTELDSDSYTNQALQNLTRDAATLRRRGATALLVKTDPDSPMIEWAKKQREMQQARRGQSIPILLIEKTELTDKYRIELPALASKKVKVRNVIGILKGSDPELSKEAVIFSAHLDHLGQRAGLTDSIFNGADDNATGVTGVMALADAYAALKTSPKRTTIFIAFWGEEIGLLGSRYYADSPVWPLDKTVAMINLEMLGRPEEGVRNKTWVTGWSESDLGEMMAIGAKRTGTIVFEHPKYSGRMLYGASDNAPLVQKGVIAHSFSAGSLHQDYHQQTDDWQKLDIPHMTLVIKGLFAGSLPITEGQLTPKKQ